MSLLCPKCHKPIPPEDVNVGADVAFCRACETPTAISSLVSQVAGSAAFGAMPAPVVADLASPPPGAWYRDDGTTVRVGATLRSGGAWFFLIFGSVWLFITTVVIGGALLSSGPGNSFPFLFMIPFLLVGLGTETFGVVLLVGAAEVTLRGGEGLVRVGAGPLSWTRALVGVIFTATTPA